MVLRRPDRIEIVNPSESDEVKMFIKKFFLKFFNDNNKRIFIIGINPGRFGGGLTGISFTDPVALKEDCGIENELGKQREFSSRFVYRFISCSGGVKILFKIFYQCTLSTCHSEKREKL